MRGERKGGKGTDGQEGGREGGKGGGKEGRKENTVIKVCLFISNNFNGLFKSESKLN